MDEGELASRKHWNGDDFTKYVRPLILLEPEEPPESEEEDEEEDGSGSSEPDGDPMDVDHEDGY